MDTNLPIYIMFVNKVTFMMVISNNLKLITAEYIQSRLQKIILAQMKRIKNTCSHKGICFSDCNYDNRFEPLQDGLTSLQIELNPVAQDKHVPEIDKFICTIKQRSRNMWNMLLFKKILTSIIIYMVTIHSMWLNMFPPTNEISTKISPRTLVTVLQITYKNHFRIDLGSYA